MFSFFEKHSINIEKRRHIIMKRYKNKKFFFVLIFTVHHTDSVRLLKLRWLWRHNVIEYLPRRNPVQPTADPFSQHPPPPPRSPPTTEVSPLLAPPSSSFGSGEFRWEKRWFWAWRISPLMLDELLKKFLKYNVRNEN